MTPAWQVRESQQQEFIENLVREIHDAAETCGFSEEHFLAKTSLTLFRQILFGLGTFYVGDADTETIIKQVRGKIDGFVRVESEVLYLYCLLFQKMMPTLFSSVLSAYHRDGLFRDLEVYGAPRMSEIPD